MMYDYFFTDKTKIDLKYVHERCQKYDECLSSFDCEEINKLKDTINGPCSAVAYIDPDNELCLRGFFRKAYAAQFSDEDSCFKDYYFLDNDLKKRRSAFINGKLCFVKYAREYCTTATIDYFNPKKYQELAESISLEEDGTDCKSPQAALKYPICKALSVEFFSKDDKLNTPGFQPNQTFMEQYAKICKDTEVAVL
ncbi:hypothetical protein CAEBREN_16266 [Caenorhabditis brenneri]|uniref:T20D4.11-like domain-containing protein n=1 Tax=Caenorhabditis brenneri TaxID=135651 RepID=G0NF14_CAEBE|nr:hypothetical protein CAEBREN_16266 [Caenorhabditis brenneri]